MKTVLLTGANSGLGLETARQLAKKGYKVILACRSLYKAQQTKIRLKKENPAARFLPLEINLASMMSIIQGVDQLRHPIHALICNAGLSYQSPTLYTEEGVELTFGVNHLGHFALTQLLLEKFPHALKRIMVVSSSLHDPESAGGPFPPPQISSIEELFHPDVSAVRDWKKEGSRRYVQSKLCNLWFVYELDRKWKARGREDMLVNAFNPGFIPSTGLARNSSRITRFMMRYLLPHLGFLIGEIRTVQQSAADLIEICMHTQESGKYFDGPKIAPSSTLSHNLDLAKKLWEESEKLCKQLA